MANNIEWGIQHVKFAPIATNGAFPDFETDGVLASMIVIDSFVHSEEENVETEIEWEDIQNKLILPSSVGSKSVTFTSNNVSKEAHAMFKGYKDGTGTNAGFQVNDPNSTDSKTFAMQYVTKALGEYAALQHEFTPVLVTVKKTGQTGKNGLPELQFVCKFQPNFGAGGKEVENHRWKEAATA